MFAKKIADLEAEIGPKRLRMKNIIETASEDGDRDLDESESQEFDELSEEVKGLEVKLGRLRALDASAATAKAVTDGDRPRPTVPAQAKAPVEKGIGFARYVMCFAAAKGNRFEAMEIAKNRYPRDQEIQQILKAAVSGGTTTDPTWAQPLVEPTNLVSEFVEYLRPMTIVGKFGTGNVPPLRRVPFNIRVPAQTSGGAADWVGEGAGKPVTKFDFTSLTLRWTKVAAISVLSEDLLRFSSPSAELLVRNSLGECLIEKLDQDFANPNVTEIQDVRPAAITQGATNTAASGVDAAAVRADIKTAVSHFITNNIPTAGIVVLMRHAQALSLSLMRNPLGVKEFPDMTMNGGILEGMPVIASQYMPQGVVAFVSADNVYLADDGGVAIDMSREASLEMDSSPNQHVSDGSPLAPTPSQLVSMFQTNSVAIRAERMINWKKRRTAAVYYLTSVGWGNEDTSPPQAAI